MRIAIRQPIAAQTDAQPRSWLVGWRGWLLSGLGLVAWIVLLTGVVYQFRAGFTVSIGDYYDTPYLRSGFSDRETSADGRYTFRWTTGPAQISAPRMGRGAWTLGLLALAAHPDSSPVNATLHFANGYQFQIPDSGELRAVHVFVPPAALSSGDLTIDITANTYSEPTASARQLGLALFSLQLSQVGSHSLLAPLGTLIYLVLIVLALALTLWATGLRGTLAVALAAALGLGLTLPLAQVRLPYAFWLPSLALLGWISLLLVVALRWLMPRLFGLGGVTIDDTALTALLLLFVVGFWIKAGGQLYPYMIAIDIHWHMERVRWILDGRLAEIYKPGAFNESVMPANEWGENRPTIPYSPFFHIFSTAFAIFPWQLETSAKVFSAFIDTSRVFIVFYLVRAMGLSRRAGLLAAVLIAIFPVTFLLHSWGNVPTTLGIWWTLIASTVIIGGWGRLNRRPAFMLLTAVLLITFLIYTVMAVYMGMLLVVWLVAVALRHKAERAQVKAAAWATALAFALSMAVYYWQYVSDIIKKTLPYFSTTLTQGQESVGATPFEESYGTYLANYIPRLWGYGLLIPLLLLPLALWLIRRNPPELAAEPRTKTAIGWLWMAAMLLIALLFVPIARSVPMVDKHIFFLIPVLAIGAGVVIDYGLRWLQQHTGAQRRYRAIAGMALTVYVGLTLLDSVQLWVDRIERIKQVW